MIHELYDRKTESLNGTWKMKIDQNDIGVRQSYYLPTNHFENWMEIKVPHNWYLVDEIGDYFGTIWYERKFSISEEMRKQRLFLHFEGIDYISEVWLNGHYLGLHEGMFDSFELEITDYVFQQEENTLVIRDSAPKDKTEYIWADPDVTPMSKPYQFHQSKGITQIKGHMIEAMHRPGSMTSHRQDGNSGGIWGDVTLTARPDIYIDYIKSYSKIMNSSDCENQDGIVSLDVFINSSRKMTVKTDLRVKVSAYNFEDRKVFESQRSVDVVPGDNIFKIVVDIPQVRLWWTWDHGRPNLYNAEVSIADDEASLHIGVKDIKTDHKGQWFLNGKHIFLRGMRYISSLWMSEANEEMWKSDFQKMLDMDINAIRIGSHVERDGVYRLCDELGLLMWQVFPLHYVIDDGDDVINRAGEMMKNMGYMLTNHACMGMWSVYKEPEIYGLQDMPNVYFRLCEVLKETLGTIDPIRWIHKGDYREGVQNIMIGSCQDGDMDIHTAEIKPNIVEFGADSIPCLESLRKFIPEDKLWPPDWDTWEYWGLFYRNQFKRAKVEMGNSLEEFIHNTQKYEALVVKEQIELLRQRKYKPVASMFLYYWSDACPIMGSGLLDYYRKPYEVYDSMKSVYTQVLVSLEWNKDPYIIGRDKKYAIGEHFVGKIWVNNDHFHEISNVTVSWSIRRMAENSILAENKKRITLTSDSAEVLDTIDWVIPENYVGEYIVEMKVTDEFEKNYSTNSMCFHVCR